MVDKNSEEYQILMATMLSLGINDTDADRAIEQTACASVDAALDWHYSNGLPDIIQIASPIIEQPVEPAYTYEPVQENPYADLIAPELPTFERN
jgi:hypothetical protein